MLMMPVKSLERTSFPSSSRFIHFFYSCTSLCLAERRNHGNHGNPESELNRIGDGAMDGEISVKICEFSSGLHPALAATPQRLPSSQKIKGLGLPVPNFALEQALSI